MKRRYICPIVCTSDFEEECSLMTASTITVDVSGDPFDSEEMESLSKRGNGLWADEEE